jgi:hypothetical protein
MDPFKPWQPKKVPTVIGALSVEDAQAVALKAVAFIAADDELLSRFVALTGCGLDGIRRRISDAGFLGGVLDFILADEPTLLTFVAAADLVPEMPALARAKLP